MTFRQLIELSLHNIQKGYLLQRMRELDGTANQDLAAEQQALAQDIEALCSRMGDAVNAAYGQLTRCFFPLHCKQSTTLDDNGYVVGQQLEHRPLRYRQITVEGRTQAFVQRGDNAEVFAQPGQTCEVVYDGLPAPMLADDDQPQLPAIVPHEVLTYAAAAHYWAQEGQHTPAAFWDARYKDALSCLIKNRGTRLPQRLWR